MSAAFRISLCRAALPAAVLLLAACAFEGEPEYVERPVEELYDTGLDALNADELDLAVENFSEVERQHPYSVWATKAQLMGAYALYRGRSYDDAILALDRFIEQHPGNRDIGYAYYLRAISHYEQITDVSRDQRVTLLALQALEEVERRYPGSDYARDAHLKLDLTRDHLAGKEMEVGRFYHERGHYLAAINRFRTVIDKYQTTTHVPEALHRLTEAYAALGIAPEARDNASVLGYNYPGSDWYADSYALVEGVPPGAGGGPGTAGQGRGDDGGFWDRLWPF